MSEVARKKPAAITKRDLLIGWIMWWFGRVCIDTNTKKGGHGFALGMGYTCRNLYDKEGLADLMTRHDEYYCSDYVFGGCINGMCIALEEKMANDLYETGESEITPQFISQLKTGLMGPFAGFGDTLTQTVLYVLSVSIAQPLAASGNLLSVLIVFLTHACWRPTVSFITMWPGYKSGKDFALKLTSSKLAKNLIIVAAILSMMMMGALTAMNVKFAPTLQAGANDLGTMLNTILPGITGLGPVFAVYALMKKNVKVPVIILMILAFGILCSLIGIM